MDIRPSWRDYLERYHLEPIDLLRPGVHLNDHNNDRMAEIRKRKLVHRPELTTVPGPEPVRTVAVGKDGPWQDSMPRQEEECSRIDVLSAHSSPPMSSSC